MNSLFPKKLLLAVLVTIISIFSACKSPPLPLEETPPEITFLLESNPRLYFTGIEAETPINLDLNFLLEVQNTLPQAEALILAAPVDINVKIASWRLELNGEKVEAGFSLDDPGELIFRAAASDLRAGLGNLSLPLKLHMDVDALLRSGFPLPDDYSLKLIINLELGGKSSEVTVPDLELEVYSLAEFPAVREPEFNITSIAILKAELVNTGFRVGLRIVNRNPFPVDLSSFSYVLYGNGRLWADGSERNIIRIPGKTALQGNLVLGMNFIDMRRDLLDQIIRLEDVNYRFTGRAEVITGVEYLPSFSTSFDLSGYSQVLDE